MTNPIEGLTLSHRAELQAAIKAVGSSFSEYSFANLYLFRQQYEHQLIRDGNRLLLTGRTFDRKKYLMPVFPIDQSAGEVLRTLACGFDFVFPVEKIWLDGFNNNGALVSAMAGDKDYIFSTDSLASYRGQKLHSKKNLLNQFLSLYQPVTHDLSSHCLADALDVLHAWQIESGLLEKDSDFIPCHEALHCLDPLGLTGFIYYAGKEPAGFLIGEELVPGMFTVHFAKGKRSFKGLYQFMFNHLAKALQPRYQYLNLQQDLDNPALRKAKLSYRPEMMLEKFRLSWPVSGNQSL